MQKKERNFDAMSHQRGLENFCSISIKPMHAFLLLSGKPHVSLPPSPSTTTIPASMASIYTCMECGTNLNLSASHLFPSDFYFEAGNKGTLSFSWVDSTKFRFEKEDKIRPFFETLNYWGIQRKRTKINCNSCGRLVGHIYDDGPPLTNSTGQFHMGPSQVIPRAPRYRFKTKALRITSQT